MAKENQPEFTAPKTCGHCDNHAPMEIVAAFDNLSSEECDEYSWSQGDCYQLLKCPACEKVELRTYFYHDGLDPENIGHKFKTLYPVSSQVPLGLPKEIEKEYKAAAKVRSISVNAYGVLMGRVLDLVCEDKGAKGDKLHVRLADLAKKNEIPKNLIPVADKLRFIRNIGAHANLGELTENEAPILENLSRAIAEV